MTGGLPIYIILQTLVGVITPLVGASGGQVIVAHDPAEGLELLANAPAGWRVILGVETETSLEDYESFLGASNSEIWAITQAGVGLAADPAAQIYEFRGDGTKPSLLEISEAVRAWIRGMQFVHEAIDCEITFSWRSAAWLHAQKEGQPVQFGRQNIFRIRHNISLPALVSPTTINWPT